MVDFRLSRGYLEVTESKGEPSSRSRRTLSSKQLGGITVGRRWMR